MVLPHVNYIIVHRSSFDKYEQEEIYSNLDFQQTIYNSTPFSRICYILIFRTPSAYDFFPCLLVTHMVVTTYNGVQMK